MKEERPPLTAVLTSVLSAAVENTNRPALLASFLEQGTKDQAAKAPVIPMPRRAPEHSDQPTPAA